VTFVSRVVVVDNDQDALDLLVMDLTLEGHEIVGTADNGADAVALCETLRPDILVVDYRMPPGLSGLDVARAVAGGPRVVVYSNYHDVRLREQVARAGATFLQKGQLSALRRVLKEEQPA
jgi:two-component system response regulator YesN